MLVINGAVGGGGGGVATPAGNSVLDSPILARVERAMLRHEGMRGADRTAVSARATYTQSLLPGSQVSADPYDALKKGLLWQHRDKLFSRWKERYFILTRDYLHCFKRASGPDRFSEMGQFVFKVKLIDVEHYEWENKKSYSIIALGMSGREGKIYLRTAQGLEDWYDILEECILGCRERRRATRMSCPDRNARSNDYNNCMGYWLPGHQDIKLERLPTDTVSTRQGTVVKRREWHNRDDEWESSVMNNRLSLLTDIDINSYDNSTLGSTSVTSYRMNEDVFCIQPPSHRAAMYSTSKDGNSDTSRSAAPHLMKFRERSYSDIQRVDRTHWRLNNF